MPTIEKAPLSPPGSRTVTITSVDRAELIDRARDVIDDYMYGNGSWWHAGPRKSLDQTLHDLNNFEGNIRVGAVC